MPIQNVTGAGVSPQGTAFFIEVRNNGASEYLLICKEIASGGRVEKQFGLPNSAASAERVSKATVEDVGWPLDLNKPKDRESVDKAISFHDL